MKNTSREIERLRADRAQQAQAEGSRAKRETIIASVSDTVATDWYRRAIRNPVRMSIYWRTVRMGERCACPIIDTSKPNEDFTFGGDVSPALTRDRVRALVAQLMRDCPVWSAEMLA